MNIKKQLFAKKTCDTFDIKNITSALFTCSIFERKILKHVIEYGICKKSKCFIRETQHRYTSVPCVSVYMHREKIEDEFNYISKPTLNTSISNIMNIFDRNAPQIIDAYVSQRTFYFNVKDDCYEKVVNCIKTF